MNCAAIARHRRNYIVIPFNVEKTRRFLRKREQARRVECERLRIQASDDLQKIVAHLVQNYRPTRIYSWGSLFQGNRFTRMSDIDVAVEGLQGPLDGLHAKSDAEEITDFPVDFVELERIHPLHAETIRGKGTLLYERK